MTKAVVRPTAEQLKPFSLSPRLYDILVELLNSKGPLSYRQLGRKLDVPSSVCRPLVNGLLEKAYVIHLPEDQPGAVHLTKSGRALILAAMTLGAESGAE